MERWNSESEWRKPFTGLRIICGYRKKKSGAGGKPAPLQIGESTRRINVAILKSNSKAGDYSYFSKRFIGDPDGV
jgi:hypothetical protein